VHTLIRSDVASRAQLIRVAVLDDHDAIRAGLESAIRSQPGIVCVGTIAHAEQLAPLLYRTRPDVLVVDYQLPRTNGLLLCRQVTREPLAPAVVVYSAYADASLVVPAIVAGADALIDKAAPTRELFAAIRSIVNGRRSMPAPLREQVAAAHASIRPRDLPIFDSLLDGAERAQIASDLGLTPAELDQRLDEMLESIAPEVTRAARGQPSPSVKQVATEIPAGRLTRVAAGDG
jgi:DNA-binding NarL/FixJ family response regulator